MGRLRATQAERLAHALGYATKRGKKHGKVFDDQGRMIAVYPLGHRRDCGSQIDNFRAALLRHARRGE